MILLAGDIGGTNSRLLLKQEQGDDGEILAEHIYASQQFDDFSTILDNFLRQYAAGLTIDSSCFAVAGPVKNATASITNLPWFIEESKLAGQLSTDNVRLINDFIGVTYGISELNDEDLLIIQQGKQRSLHPDAAVIGAGTGLGVAHRKWNGSHYLALSSEAGHSGFSPANPVQTSLLHWLQQSSSHVSNEMLLSGQGLSVIYRFNQQVMNIPESDAVRVEMQYNDAAKVITEYATQYQDELCCKTLELFIEIYGSVAGNAALYYYPVEEIFIAGGIAAKLAGFMRHSLFTSAFCNKGPMSSNMQAITISLILNEKAGMLGALSQARRLTQI